MASPFMSFSNPGQGIRTPPGGGQNFNMGAGGFGGSDDFLQAFVQDKGNLMNRLSAYERNLLDQEGNRLNNQTQMHGIDTGRSNLMDQLRSQEGINSLNNQTQRYGIDQNFNLGNLTSQRNLEGTKYGADRGAQAALGSAALGVQGNVIPAMLGHQRFLSMAPAILGGMGSMGRGMGGGSNLANALGGG